MDASGAPGARRRGVWVDCDPGHDDAMMLILAGHSDALRLLGVSTVAGNVPLDATTLNARRVLWAAGLPEAARRVVAGAAAPLLRAPRCCPEVHGESGLGGFDWPALPSTVRRARATAAAAASISHSYSLVYSQRVLPLSLRGGTAALTRAERR